MKRSRLLFITCCLLLLTSCGQSEQKEETINWTPLQIAQAVLGSQPELSPMAVIVAGDELYDSYIGSYYGFNLADVADGVIFCADAASAQEIAVLRLAEGSDMDEARQIFSDYSQRRLGAFTGYLPDEAALVENASIAVHRNMIALLICPEPDLAEAAFQRAFTGVSPDDLAKSVNQLSSEQVEDITWGYDSARLLNAWQQGDWSGLAQRDQEILNVCQKVIGGIAGDLSDYEKELAVHDWMLANGRYDTNRLSNLPQYQENPDNDNPYGFLIDGVGICRGYTSTFQLFMDLLGIECISVQGQSNDARNEHAWNMVRLDGQWYCVDVTWDDPTTDQPVSVQTAHRYFNVTSEFMRSTRHYWDELVVPDASATDLAWSDNGPDHIPPAAVSKAEG